jgi:MFS family permease
MGLIEALPIMIVSLFGGHYSDKFDRRKIIILFIFVLIAGSGFLTWFAQNGPEHLRTYGITPILLVVLIIGIARGFLGPAIPAFSAQLVPKEFYTNAATWNSTVWQLGAVTGPAIGGICYVKFGACITSFVALILMCATVICYLLISSKPVSEKFKEESMFQSLAAGIKFVFKNQIIISAITLDLFAVLFGGAVAMLPVFADQVLHVGPDGLGYLRAAPALGAVIMAVVLAYFPPVKNSGKKLLWCVALFGISMIVFALSENFILSFIILMLSGMFDSVSVVIRHTIIQIFTPDEMRGRVSSVNSIFIGASNEIGAFESGFAARLMGLIPSVIFGGVATLLVVASALKFAPTLKNMHLQKHTN